MSTTIVGSANPDHIVQNARAAARGPLPPDLYAEACRRFTPNGLSGARP
jgi:hypothetical protein